MANSQPNWRVVTVNGVDKNATVELYNLADPASLPATPEELKARLPELSPDIDNLFRRMVYVNLRYGTDGRVDLQDLRNKCDGEYNFWVAEAPAKVAAINEAWAKPDDGIVEELEVVGLEG